MSRDLDSIVKGAATPAAAHEAGKGSGTTPISGQTQPQAGPGGDATNNAPNTPSMVYLNLLILEASLRAQFLELRARRRHHTLFLTLLALWIAGFGYLVFLAPREDGLGVGGSIYWAVEGAQKVCLMGGLTTAVLVWAVGIWERGIRWPRRWFAISNRGLRPFNCKLVLARRPWYAEAVSSAAFFLTYGLFSHTASSSYRYVDAALLRDVQRQLNLSADAHPTLLAAPAPDDPGHEEDLAPGGDYVKLLLLAKPFSPTFRENWELYRSEYWDRENERRALLRQRVNDRDRALAKQKYGWLWWLPGRRVTTPTPAPTPSKASPHHLHPHARHHPDRKRRSSSSSNSVLRQRRGSASSSRSATPVALDSDDNTSVTSTATAPRKTRRQASTAKKGAAASPAVAASDSRSVTPDIPSPLAMERSASSDSVDADDDASTTSAASARVLRSSSARKPSDRYR